MSGRVVTLKLDDASLAAALASFDALTLWAKQGSGASEAVLKLLHGEGLGVIERGLLDGSRIEMLPATRTDDCIVAVIKPGERMIELCAAIADEGDGWSVEFRHGWPILSLVCGPITASVAEAGGVSSPARGGAR